MTMTEDTFNDLQEFQDYRKKMNEIIHQNGNLVTKRFFNLDGKTYDEGALNVKTKELLGLVASTVLRCDDCITYHIVRCVQEKVSKDEFFEAMNVALIVGGSIVIPHFRRAVERFFECERLQEQGVDLDLASARDST